MLLTVFYWPIEFSNTAIIAPKTTRSMRQTFSSASSSPLFGRAPPSGSYATHRCLLLFSACIRKFYIACRDIKCSKHFAVSPNEPFYFLHSMLFTFGQLLVLRFKVTVFSAILMPKQTTRFAKTNNRHSQQSVGGSQYFLFHFEFFGCKHLVVQKF